MLLMECIIAIVSDKHNKKGKRDHREVMLYSIPSFSFFLSHKSTAKQYEGNKILVDLPLLLLSVHFYSSLASKVSEQRTPCIINCWHPNPDPGVRELTLESVSDAFFQNISHTLCPTPVPHPAVLPSVSKSQSTGLIVEYVFTHRWVLFSLSSATLQLHLPNPHFCLPSTVFALSIS